MDLAIQQASENEETISLQFNRSKSNPPPANIHIQDTTQTLKKTSSLTHTNSNELEASSKQLTQESRVNSHNILDLAAIFPKKKRSKSKGTASNNNSASSSSSSSLLIPSSSQGANKTPSFRKSDIPTIFSGVVLDTDEDNSPNNQKLRTLSESQTTSSTSGGDVRDKSKFDRNSESQKLTICQEIKNDFGPSGDKKIVRAVGRTATVNSVIFLSHNPVYGFFTGGLITARRLQQGWGNADKKEIAKAVTVWGCATSSSTGGQFLAKALLMGAMHMGVVAAAPIVVTAGCACGITIGALSEWGVDSAFKRKERFDKTGSCFKDRSSSGSDSELSELLGVVEGTGGSHVGKKRERSEKF